MNATGNDVLFWVAMAPLGVFLWAMVIAFIWELIAEARRRWKQ